MTVREEWEMACPKCGSDEHLNIAATVWVRLTDDGTDITEPTIGDHEWTDRSACQCENCGWSGKVWCAREAVELEKIDAAEAARP